MIKISNQIQKQKKIIFYILVFCFVLSWSLYTYFRKPLVSVVMPVYNRADMVRRAIDSILNQTFKDFEFIIVDDGSTDGTSHILDYYMHKDSRIRVIKNENNRGIAYSRNRGNKIAQGKYIAVMDSDDYAMPDRLEKQVAFMKNNPSVDAVIGSIKDINELDINKINIKNSSVYHIAQMPGHYEFDLFFYNAYPNVTSLFKREFIWENGVRYNPSFISAEDYDFWKQFVMNGGKLAALKDTLVYVRFHISNTPRYYDEMTKNSVEIHRQLFNLFFQPKPEELKFRYTQFEKCSILTKIIHSNKKRKIFSQTDLKAFYDKQCPENINTSIYIVHPFWETFLIFDEKNDMYYRADVGVKAHVERNGDFVYVKWVDWPMETFKKSNDGSYVFVPPSNKLHRFVHPLWEDDIYIDGNLFSRFSVKDTGEFLEKTNDKAVLKWHVPGYDIETYINDSNKNKWIYQKKTQ